MTRKSGTGTSRTMTEPTLEPSLADIQGDQSPMTAAIVQATAKMIPISAALAPIDER